MFEEIVAFVVDENECGKIFHFDFPDGFHAELGIFEAFDTLDIVLSEDSSRTSDTAEVESSVFFAGVGDSLAAVTFCQHNHRAPVTLEEVYVGIHSTSCRGTHRSASHAFRRFCRTCIVDGVIFDILRQVFAPVEPFFEFGVRDVPTDDNRSVERQTCGNGIFIQLFENFAHRLVEVYFNGVAFTGLAEFFGNEFAGVTVEFLDPNTVLVDFTFDVSVGRAAHSQSYGAGCSVAGQTDNAYVVCQIFTAELCTESDTVRFFQDLFFQLDVTESSSEFVSGRGQTIVVVGGCQ